MTEEQKANDASRYVLLDLSRSHAGGFPELGAFASEGDARKEAERLAGMEPHAGHEIAVYQKIGSAKLEPRVTWKGAAR